MKILFVNHSCERTGAPLVLLYFLRWLKINKPDIQIDVLSLREGELEDEFQKVSNKHFVFYRKEVFLKRLIRFVLRKIGILKLNRYYIYNYQINKLIQNKYDIIYHNTIVDLGLSVNIKNRSKAKLILHVHEMKKVISELQPNLKSYLRDIDQIISASIKVKSDLENEWMANNISVIYEFADLPISPSRKLDNEKIIIGGCGVVSERKGVDLFIKVAHSIVEKRGANSIQFRWLGNVSDIDKDKYLSLVRSLSIEDSFQFLPPTKDVDTFYEKLDLFLMTSREDPFPLVCIEAGNYGVPIFCFDGATGTQEMINDLKYLIVPKFDVDLMAKKINDLLEDKKLLGDTSRIVRSRFKEFNICTQSEKIYAIIQSV